MSKPPQERLLSGGHDERNLARLSLVLANNRVPKDKASWVKEFPSPGGLSVTIKVECTAPRHDVVPHGTDNDVLLGLINAYIAAGMPRDGVIRTTGYTLLNYSTLGDSGSHYATLTESLRRFQGTVYTITDSWYDNNSFQYRSVTTSLVLRFVMLDKDRKPDLFGDLRAETLLEITLDSDLTASIRSGFIRPLDLQFLRRLNQPLPRLLFRVLSEQRHPIGQAPVGSFQVGLKAWAQHLGILDERPFRIRRALEPAHQQLKEQGFLREVTYLGRGDSQEVQYIFAELPLLPANPETVSILTQRGVSHAIAVQLAAQYGLEHTQDTVRRFEELLKSGYKARSKPALLIDLLRNPEKYSAQTPPAAPPAPRSPAPEPLFELDPPRTEQSARFLLRGLNLHDEALQRAVALFLDGTVSVTDLTGLRRSDDPARDIARWQAR